MAPSFSSGLNTPESELESMLPAHPTAVRRPYAITVQSENTSYSDEFIVSKFTNRGADVSVSNGQYVVTPTAKPFEFQTARKVAKTGYVSPSPVAIAQPAHAFPQPHAHRYGRQ